MHTFSDITAWVLPLLIAITFHEAAHGYVADLFGDPTARRAGRITFNPLRHIDRFGTIVLPGLLLLLHSPVLFGYARPVPVSFNRLKPRRMGELCVAAAGPGINILLAIVTALLLHMEALISPERAPWLYMNLYRSLIINCTLAVFNLVPILPLDGGRVLHAILPPGLSERWARTERYGIVLILALLFLPGLSTVAYSVIGGGTSALVDGVLMITGNGTALTAE